MRLVLQILISFSIVHMYLTSACYVSNCYNCDNYNANRCILCHAGYILTIYGTCIMRCTDLNCLSCPNDINRCETCNVNYYISSGGCARKCGALTCLTCYTSSGGIDTSIVC